MTTAQDKLWHVYLLECADDTLYTGITNDLEGRMDKHKSGKGSRYVRSHGFGKLLHAILVDDKSTALRMEHAIKQLERNEKVTFFMGHENLLF